MLRSIIFTLTLTAALFAPGVFTPAEAVTLSSDRVFAYAEANYPTLFPGPAANQQFQQYTYRYYPTSKNYLGVDTANDIFWLGPDTGNVITKVGTVASFADAIIAWEALSASVTSSFIPASAGVTSQNGVTATGGDNSIAVSWTNNCIVCSWQISTKRTQGNAPWIIRTVQPKGTTHYTIQGLDGPIHGQEYLVKMEAKRASRWDLRAVLTVSTTLTPPSGSWSALNIDPQMSFASYLDSSDTGLAVAGLDNDLNPSVWTCSPNFTGCKKVTDGLVGVNAPNALQYDPDGNLFGMFTESVAQVNNPIQTVIKKLGINATTWQLFPTKPGADFALDVTSRGALMGGSWTFCDPKRFLSDFCTRGMMEFYDPNGGVIRTQAFQAASVFTAVAYDAQLGSPFLGGFDYTKDSQVQPFASVWVYDFETVLLTKLTMPTVVTQITYMVSDGHGVIYIAGSDIMNNGKVWKYENGVVTDTGLDAFQVTTLDYSSNGYLIAGGQDNVNYNGQVWYYNPQTTSWTSLGLTGGFVLVNVSVNNVSNTVYALGKNNSMASTVWTYQ